ncbi:PREDICTED: putative late blight resistance protein homolog R1A-10 [Erythranthe guttata]|uniref:putative late blight resistance protein homolog R1A-10 n=1 Tax=Erythranthe guttata TaxID=4155 RepID=UPI00064D813D|nr:PREDICTED: putative late blight resistance protein homolog R1A-10 [Erythranthe guttata]|eukprot:XP_012829190.1 PREDICTED: putative late blight resistance protein homolog R1A-10 [Erythranthe guttata]
MAYAAVCCIEQTLKRLLNSSHISIVQTSSPQIISLLYEEILSLREALREFNECRVIVDMKMVKTLEAGIIDVVYKFEDVIDLHISNQFHSLQSDEETDHPPLMVHSLDVQEIKQDVDSFIEMVDKMKRAYTHELCNPTPHDEEDGFFISTRIDFGGNESNMVGLSDQFTRIKGRLLNSSQSERMVVCLAGMAGIGKTTLAKKLCQDPLITSHFSAHVFVTIGPKWRSIYTLIDILKQLDPRPREIKLLEGEEVLDCLKRSISESLKGLRYLIVLDDVWNEELELVNSFPDDKNGSRVLLTTRIEEVGKCLDCGYNVRFLDKKESWDLLREKVFGEEESFSYALERARKKIAENCEGLPLTIVTVGDILSKSEKTLEYWNEVADEKQHSVYKDAYDQMSNVLYPSYDYLPQHLKACFLYIGAFPQSYMLHVPRLMNLWSAEGFPDSEPILSSDPPTIFASNTYYYYICELRRKSVVMFDREQRGYRLHSSFWYLCNKEAAKNKLFYALNCRADALREEGTNLQPRRLCIRNNVLLAIEDVHDSIASASTVRSLLCTGPFHQYYVPLSFLKHLRLLRVLHALSIRFYEFPMEVVKLVQLRYLSLLYDGDIPPSISKLWNLEYLIFG